MTSILPMGSPVGGLGPLAPASKTKKKGTGLKARLAKRKAAGKGTKTLERKLSGAAPKRGSAKGIGKSGAAKKKKVSTYVKVVVKRNQHLLKVVVKSRRLKKSVQLDLQVVLELEKVVQLDLQAVLELEKVVQLGLQGVLELEKVVQLNAPTTTARKIKGGPARATAPKGIKIKKLTPAQKRKEVQRKGLIRGAQKASSKRRSTR